MAGSGQISEMVEVAGRRGRSSRYPWDIEYSRGAWHLYHYRTHIVSINDYGKVNLGGGYSPSDRDGINNFFRALNLPYFCTNARTKRTLRKFRDEYGEPIAQSDYMMVFRYKLR